MDATRSDCAPRNHLRRPTLWAALPAALLASASCVQHVAPRTTSLGGREVSLRYEGSCAHLACCSMYAVSVPPGTAGAFRCGAETRSCRAQVGWFAPGFTCDPFAQGRYRQPEDRPYLSCNDNERWLSFPGLTHTSCGERYLVCYRGVRVTAVARDKSASNDSGKVHYEASLGLLRALGLDPEARETFVSIYALHERERMASDPHCVGGGR